MIELKMISTEEDLIKETGLTRDELWDAGFNLDDWDTCFVSETRLVEEATKGDYEYGYEYGEPIDDAYWLIRRMEGYCEGLREVNYAGKYYYTVYHS